MDLFEKGGTDTLQRPHQANISVPIRNRVASRSWPKLTRRRCSCRPPPAFFLIQPRTNPDSLIPAAPKDIKESLLLLFISFHFRNRESPTLSSYSNSPLLMTSSYRCASCGADLNLSEAYRYPPGTYFEAGDKGTVSFSWVDDSRFRYTKEDKLRPFFETINYWGLQRKRTKIQCDACGYLVGYVYDDGPPMMTGTGQWGFGPSQVIPRAPRYRFKTKALTITQ